MHRLTRCRQLAGSNAVLFALHGANAEEVLGVDTYDANHDRAKCLQRSKLHQIAVDIRSERATKNKFGFRKTQVCPTAFLLLIGFYSGILQAQQAPDEPGIDATGYEHIDARGSGLFAVPIPGETFDPLSGKIGHTHNDMVIKGNGVLPIVVQRKFQSVPKAYPYDFGTMELNIPRLTIDTLVDVSALDYSPDPYTLNCHSWDPGNMPVRRVWDSISFDHPGGHVSLVDKRFVKQSVKNQFPSNARYISSDNWYLTCSSPNNTGANFELHGPDGSIYRLSHQERVYAERKYVDVDIHNTPAYVGTNSVDFSDTYRRTSQYTIYVSEIEKLGSKLTYTYEASPVEEPKAFPPVFIGEYKEWNGTNEVDRNFIRGKKRLKQIKGFYRPESGANSWVLDRVVDIAYRSATASTCPNLISGVWSSNAPMSQTTYSSNHYVATNGAHSVDQCRLARATRADGSFWSFTYGLTSTQPFAPGGDFFGEEEYAQIHLPLRAVKIPSGAVATYDYIQLGVCEYQNAYEEVLAPNDTYNNYNDCSDDEEFRHPAVVKRVINGSDISTTVTNIGYEEPEPNPDHLVTRRIDNPVRRHDLTFGRIERHQSVTGTPSALARLLHSGKLLEQKTGAKSSNPHGVFASGDLYSEVDYEYFENPNGFINHSSYTHPPLKLDNVLKWEGAGYVPIDNPNYRSDAGRFKFLYDANRFNLKTTTRQFNGDVFKVTRRSHDIFNFPTRIDESHERTGNLNLSRTTAINYDHGSQAKRSVGKIAYKGTGTTVNFQPSNADLATEQLSYNDDGQLTTETINGFTTQFTYWPSGDLKATKDGENNTTLHSNYKLGVARSTLNALNGTTTRIVGTDGLVTRIVDPEGKRENWYYDVLGRVREHWKGTVRSSSLYTRYPDWHSYGSVGNAIYTRRSGREHKWTFLDVLGRPKSQQWRSDINGVKRVYRKWSYDNMGRLIYASDPSRTNGGYTGSSFGYDLMDRLTSSSHSSGAAGMTYCYGVDCNSGSSSIPGVSIRNGYIAVDAENFKTAYEYVAFGHPGNQDIVKIYQQVSGADVVQTKIDRNVHGFITKVTQGNGFERVYTPLV